jgi:hypothetical protein
MRDDLHKSCPSRRAWRNFLRACVRECDHGEKAERACFRALARDWNAEVSPRFLRALLALARSDGELFAQKLGSHRSSFSLGGEGGVLEQQLFGMARVLDSQGRFNEGSLDTAIVACLTERLTSEGRGLHGFVSREGGRNQSCLSELKRATQTCPLGELSRRILADGGHAKTGARIHSPVAVDENLLRA